MNILYKKNNSFLSIKMKYKGSKTVCMMRGFKSPSLHVNIKCIHPPCYEHLVVFYSN